MPEHAAAPARPPLVVGLLGGVAAGKSFVAELLAARGAEVLDADRIAHRQLAAPDVIAQIANAFGPEVLDAEGRVDRERLAARVFDDREAKRRLEGMIHPAVAVEIQRRLAALARPPGQARAVAVLDVPLLMEVGMHAACDELWLVDAAEATRRARAAGRGWSPDELARREAHQAPLTQKRAVATAVIPNDGDADATRAAVEAAWRERIAPRLAR